MPIGWAMSDEPLGVFSASSVQQTARGAALQSLGEETPPRLERGEEIEAVPQVG